MKRREGKEDTVSPDQLFLEKKILLLLKDVRPKAYV